MRSGGMSVTEDSQYFSWGEVNLHRHGYCNFQSIIFAISSILHPLTRITANVYKETGVVTDPYDCH